MYRQSSSRSQRNKGIKVKHALQICLLLAVSFWLIYQVKRSHDKKKEFDESDAKDSLHGENGGGFIKLGRKDIHARDQESVTKFEQHDEAAEEEETGEEEVEENKHEEYRPEDKQVEEEDEGSRDGDDETDEHEVEKLDIDVDQEEDSANDGEREDVDETENEEKTINDGSGLMEKENSVEDGGHDGGDKNHHGARKELYKADDASSAVTHDNHTEANENENVGVEIADGHHKNILEQGNKENNREQTNNGEIKKQLEVEIGGITEDDKPSNATTSENKENTLGSSEKGTSPNNTLTEVSNDNLETSNSTTEVTTQKRELSLQNVTESVPELVHGQGIPADSTPTERSNLQTIALERANNSTLDMENHLLDSNSTGHAESKISESNFKEFSIPSNETDSSTLVKTTRSEDSLEAGTNTESATEKNEETESAKSDISDGTDEVLGSAITENPEEVQNDSVNLSDSSNSLDDKNARVDLDTLPEQTERTDREDAVSE